MELKYFKYRVVAAVAIGLSLASVFAGCSKGSKSGDAAKAATQPPTPVFVSKVKTGTIAQTIPVTGNLATLYTINLSPQTAGKLINVYVREGDTVRKGEVVAEIDPTEAQST